LDILAVADDSAAIMDVLQKHPAVKETIARGDTKHSVRLKNGLQLDLRVVPAESYGAASIVSLATKMSRAPLSAPSEHAGVQAFAQLLMNRELTDGQLAQQVKQANTTWVGAPAVEPAVVPIESLLYRGKSAIMRARQVRDELAAHWQRGSLGEPAAHALFEELGDLLELAVTT
jgi:hypothetical protein